MEIQLHLQLIIESDGTTAPEFDANGYATGEVTFEAQNWQDAVQGAVEHSQLPKELTDAAEQILTMLATLNGGRDTLDVTLGLEDGTILLGPLPIGKVPPLQWP